MRTGLRRRHPVTLATVESDINLQRLGEKRSGPQLIEDVVGIERTVIVANSGVVTPDDKMRAAEILPNKGVQQRDRKSTRLNSSHRSLSRMPSSA